MAIKKELEKKNPEVKGKAPAKKASPKTKKETTEATKKAPVKSGRKKAGEAAPKAKKETTEVKKKAPVKKAAPKTKKEVLEVKEEALVKEENLEAKDEVLEVKEEAPVEEETLEAQEEVLEVKEESPVKEENLEVQEEVLEAKEETPVKEENLDAQEEVLEAKEESLIKEEPIDEANLTKKEKRKLKKEAKRRKKYFFESDIKYKGPFSYRYLRVIAWMSLAVSQIILLNSISAQLLPAPIITSEGLELFISAIGALSVPLFFMATFATILNKNKSFKSVIIFYAAAYLAIAFGFMIFYLRYVDSVLDAAKVAADSRKSISVTLSSKAQVNVFADLLALALFFFFLNYKPTKHFQTKKSLILFRSFCIIPLLVAAGSYAINVMVNFGVMQINFLAAPFLTTKPPVVYAVFILIAIWMKRRERTYYKLGGTEEGYAKFEKSNRNSLSFGVVVSVLFLIFSVIDFSIAFVLVYLAEYKEMFEPLAIFLTLDGGAASGLFFAIPFMLLFSYNKTHKPSSADLLIVLAGIAMVAFVFLEMGRDILVIMFKSGSSATESIKMFLNL